MSPPRNSTVEGLLGALPGPEPVLIAGELSADQVIALEAAGHVLVAPVALRTRRPAAVATIGWQRLQAGDTDDAATLEPQYTGRDRG
jgi:hypothetical protein